MVISLKFSPLIKAVLPEDVHNEILEVIVAETLQEMANESKHFIQYLKESTQNKEYGALIQICPLLRDIKFGGLYFSLNIHISKNLKKWKNKTFAKFKKELDFYLTPTLTGGLCENQRPYKYFFGKLVSVIHFLQTGFLKNKFLF